VEGELDVAKEGEEAKVEVKSIIALHNNFSIPCHEFMHACV